MEPITIILADAQYLIRMGIRHLLHGKDRYRIVAEAGDEDELLAAMQSHAPDVVIMDYNQPTSFSHHTVEKIKKNFPQSNILVISADNDKQSIYQVLERGVNSFLTKACDEEEIFDAINATAKNEKFFCTKILDFLLEKSFAKSETFTPTPLTPREIEIVRLVANGFIAKEIADRLNLSTHTVYTHRKNIMKKLNLSSSSELVLYAVNFGLVDNI